MVGGVELKILRVIPSLDPARGGPVEGIKQYQPYLENDGARVEVACCDAPGSPWLAASGLPVVHALGPATGGYGYSARLLPWLRQNHMHYDAVIVHGLWQYPGWAVWRALAGTSTPYYVFTHGMLDPWFKRTYPLKHLKKWLYWPWAEYRVLRDARRVIFTSEEERLLARESFWLYKVREAVTTYGVSEPPVQRDEALTEFFGDHPELRGKRIVLFLSRIHEKKGCDLLLDAFAKVARVDPSLHLVMAGPDQTGWLARLKKQADESGIGHRVSWPGMLQGRAKWGAYYSAEIFCLPSHQENFGIVVAEALACGTPVLISNKVNIWREIEAGAAGLVADDTQAGVDGLLRRWQEMSKADIAAMAVRARQCFMERFHVQQAAAWLLELIRERK